MSKYSLIVPVYNVEKYVEKCLHSILMQNYTDYEVIVVDDGSTDKSGKIVDRIMSERPEKIQVIHQENRGLGGARNTGLALARGEYIWFIDSDDTIEQNALEELEKFLSKNTAEIVVFDCLYVDQDGKEISYEQGFSKKGTVSSLKDNPELLFMPNSACNKIYSRSLFEKTEVTFQENKWFEDLGTIVKLYPYANKIGYLDKPLYLYLQRQGSIMKNPNVEKNKEIIEIFDSIISYYKNSRLYNTYKAEIEFLAILHVYLLASVRVVKIDYRNSLLKKFKQYILDKFPDYKNNKYNYLLCKKYKLILFLLDKERYFELRILFSITGKTK